MKKTVFVNVVLTVLLVGLFDLAAYWLVPDRYLLAFADYRRGQYPSESGIAGWPRSYYVANEARGFDIGVNRAAQHWVDGITYPIWPSRSCPGEGNRLRATSDGRRTPPG